VLSFYAPYACDACKTQFQAVIDAYVHKDAIVHRRPPPMKCPKCGADARYDGSIEAFAAACEKVEPKKERSIPDPGGPNLQRHDGADGTRLVLVGELATSLRWRSALDGVDGVLELDLTRSTTVAQGGVAPLLLALRAAAPTLSAVTLHGAPVALAQALRLDPIGQLTITSVVVDGECPSCKAARRALVDVVGGRWEESLSKGVACPKCGTRLEVGAMLDAVPQRSFPIGLLLGGSAALAGIGLLVVLVGLVLAGYSGWSGAPEDDDLPQKIDAPEQRLVMGDDVVAAIGRGGPLGTRAEAETAARNKALGLLVSALSREIATRRGTSAGALEVAPDQVQRFVEAVPEASAPPLESKATDSDGGVIVEAKYGLPRPVFDRLAASYAEEKSWGGLTLIRPFPPSTGLKVVKSDVAGIEPGTKVVRVDDGPVDTLAALPESAVAAKLAVQDADGTEHEVTLP
jgi:hypothetical protein